MFDSPWVRLNLQLWALAVESTMVIALRLQKIAWGGYGAQHEAYRMVGEKVTAGQAVNAIMLQNGPNVTTAKMSKAVRHYRGKVAANKRRLSK
jgi:hypothetical protein